MAHRSPLSSLFAITLLLLTCAGTPATSHGQTVVDFFQLGDKLGPPQYVYILDWNGTDFSMKREAVKE